MSPDDLAQLHSKIIDAKLAELKELFKSVNIDSGVKIETLFNGLELDNAGKVMKSVGNRKIMNAAIAFTRKNVHSLRPVVFNRYLEAVDQINSLATEYIVGLNGKEKTD